MGLRKTTAQMRKELAADVALKMALEVKFEKDLRKFFNLIADEFEKTFKRDNMVINPAIYKSQLIDTMRKHMGKAAARFENGLRNDIKDDNPDVFFSPTIEQEVRLTNSNSIGREIEDASQFITRSINNDLTAVVAASVAFFAQNNIAASKDSIAKEATKRFKQRTDARPALIAQTEIQFAAEMAKENEAKIVATDTMVDIDGVPIPEIKIIKVWNSTLDGKTRPSHAVADGQARKLDDPFTVQGQSMQFPKDTSMGATADNVINCRCGVSHTTGRPTKL